MAVRKHYTRSVYNSLPAFGVHTNCSIIRSQEDGENAYIVDSRCAQFKVVCPTACETIVDISQSEHRVHMHLVYNSLLNRNKQMCMSIVLTYAKKGN